MVLSVFRELDLGRLMVNRYLEKRSHAAWRAFFFRKERSRAAWRSKCSESLRQHGAPDLCFPIYFGFVVFIVLHVWRSGALFSNSLWPSVPFLEVVFFRLGALVLYFPVCGALLLSLLGVALSCLLTGRVRSGAQSSRHHLGACQFMMAAKKHQKTNKK